MDAYAEVDLVDAYTRTMREEFDNSLVRYRIVNTRKAPGTPYDRRHDMVYPHCVPIHCKIGWIDLKKVRAIHNVSTISAHADVPHRLVELLADAMRHWGGLYVHGHRCLEPSEQKEKGITITPFQINGPSAGDYAKRLDKLGYDLGRVFVDFCRGRADDAAIKFTSGGMSKKSVL